MKCPSCHSENIEGADECSHCGTPLYGLDTAEYKGPDFIRRPLSEMRKRPIHTVKINDPVSLAVHTMQREDVNYVFVKDGDRIAGILTSWDILYKVAGPNEDLLAVTCDKIMTPDPYILDDDDTIAVALNAMATGSFRHLPLAENGTPTGLITANDVFRYISPHLV